jgi:hypothetical protein
LGGLLRLVWWLAEVFGAVYVLVSTAAFVFGLVGFLFELPGALRKDVERWRQTRAEPPRILRYVINENEFRAPALPAPLDPEE